MNTGDESADRLAALCFTVTPDGILVTPESWNSLLQTLSALAHQNTVLARSCADLATTITYIVPPDELPGLSQRVTPDPYDLNALWRL